MKQCNAKIRPFGDLKETVECRQRGEHSEHIGYAPSMPFTQLHWNEYDRRNFRGEWSDCKRIHDCILPKDHHGDCAS